MGLFTPIYMKKNLSSAKWNKAYAVVRAMTDAERLTEIALKAPDEGIRKAAAEALNDPDALARVAIEDDSDRNRVGEAAIKRLIGLGDRDALTRAAMESREGWRAVDVIDDEAQLAEIARKAKSGLARADAVGKVKDPAVLIAAASDTDAHVRRCAVARTDDVETLARAALEDADKEVRAAAAKNPALNDSAALAKVALGDGERAVREAAVENPGMTDQAALEKIALEDEWTSVRESAIRKLDGVPALERIANFKGKPETVSVLSLATGKTYQAEAHRTCWTAALRLSEVAPDRAVEPLVKLMKMDRDSTDDFYKRCMTDGAAFLEKHYRETADAAVRESIAGLENGRYGDYRSDSNSCSHTDGLAHFDLER